MGKARWDVVKGPWQILFVVAATGLFIYWQISKDLKLADDPAKPALEINAAYRLGDQAVMGCDTQDEFNRIGQFAVQGDKTAFEKNLGEALTRGACRRLNTG